MDGLEADCRYYCSEPFSLFFLFLKQILRAPLGFPLKPEIEVKYVLRLRCAVWRSFPPLRLEFATFGKRFSDPM